jgi:SAM-dependent methyltransferase
LRACVPWWARIAGKLVLSRLPVPDRVWQRIGIFSPGTMLDPDYALAVFERHFEAAGRPPPGFAFLELGPGDSLASAVIGHAYGAARGWLVDSGAYASRDMAVYGKLIAKLRGMETPVPLPDGFEATDVEGLLARCNATFLEDGLASFKAVPDRALDMVFSEAVLEHVPRDEFAAIVGEIHRVLKPGGIASHVVDYRDHLGGGLNNLRFSQSLWEAPWFARRSGFYTNRLRPSEMAKAFREAGFEVSVTVRARWPELPLRRAALVLAFRGLGDGDLLTAETFVRLVKP